MVIKKPESDIEWNTLQRNFISVTFVGKETTLLAAPMGGPTLDFVVAAQALFINCFDIFIAGKCFKLGPIIENFKHLVNRKFDLCICAKKKKKRMV